MLKKGISCLLLSPDFGAGILLLSVHLKSYACLVKGIQGKLADGCMHSYGM